MENILELKHKVQEALEDFSHLFESKHDSKETLYAALKLISLTSRKMSMYNPQSVLNNPIDQNLYDELDYMVKNESDNFISTGLNTLMYGSISILRFVTAQKFLKNEIGNYLPDGVNKNLTETILEIREKFTAPRQEREEYFSPYFMPFKPDYLNYILDYNNKEPYRNWGALYRHLLPFIYNEKLKYGVWHALEVLRDNLLKDLNLEESWECINSQGWHNHVRSYYGFEGPSNYGSQRAVIMLHPKNIPDHKNSVQLVCYFHDNVIDYGLDVGLNAKKFEETEEYQNWQYIRDNNEITDDYVTLYNNIQEYFKDENLAEKAIKLNEKIIKNHTVAEVTFTVEGDAKYEDKSSANLYNDNTEANSGGNNGNKPPSKTKNTAGDEDNNHDRHNNVSIIAEEYVSELYPNIKYYEDALDRSKIANTIVDDFLINPKAESMNIGILGDWGSGKSQIICLIKNRIAGIEEGLIPKEKEVKSVIQIDFDAWQYDKRERIWASLALKFMEKCRMTHRMFDFKFFFYKIATFLTNNWEIIFLKYLFLWLIYLFIFYLNGLFLSESLFLSLYGLSFLQLNLLIFAIIFIPELFKPVFANIEVSFAKLFKKDNCREKLGFEHEIKEHIKYTLKCLSDNPKNRIVLFIENLDRCSSLTVKETLDAISRFLEIVNENKKIKYHKVTLEKADEVAPEKNNIEIFAVFAMDKNIILDALKNENIPEEKAFNYLEKMLNMIVPLPHQENIESYINRLFGKYRNDDIEHIIKLYNSFKFPPRRLANFRYFEYLKTRTMNTEINLEDIDRIFVPEVAKYRNKK